MVQAEGIASIKALRWRRRWYVQGTESMSVWTLYYKQLRNEFGDIFRVQII